MHQLSWPGPEALHSQREEPLIICYASRISLQPLTYGADRVIAPTWASPRVLDRTSVDPLPPSILNPKRRPGSSKATRSCPSSHLPVHRVHVESTNGHPHIKFGCAHFTFDLPSLLPYQLLFVSLPPFRFIASMLLTLVQFFLVGGALARTHSPCKESYSVVRFEGKCVCHNEELHSFVSPFESRDRESADDVPC